MLYGRKKQAERPGIRHWIRTVLLLAVTAGITWYSQSDRNNPFRSRYIIEVGTRAGVPYIACVKDRFPKTAELLFLPENISERQNSSPLPFDSVRILVTETREQSLPKALRIQEWLVSSCRDTTNAIESSDEAFQPRDFGRCKIRPLALDGESGCGIIIDFEKTSLLYLDSSAHLTSEKQRVTLRESFDIIATNGSISHTRRLRNTLRPLEIVSIGPSRADSPRVRHTGNISYARVNNGMIQYHKDIHKQLHLRRVIPLVNTPSDDSSGFSDATPTK